MPIGADRDTTVLTDSQALTASQNTQNVTVSSALAVSNVDDAGLRFFLSRGSPRVLMVEASVIVNGEQRTQVFPASAALNSTQLGALRPQLARIYLKAVGQ